MIYLLVHIPVNRLGGTGGGKVERLGVDRIEVVNTILGYPIVIFKVRFLINKII